MPPTHPREIFVCLLVGLLGYGAQISLTYGLRSAKAAPAIATSYLSVVWGVLAGYFLFKEVRHPVVAELAPSPSDTSYLRLKCCTNGREMFTEIAHVISICVQPAACTAHARPLAR